MTMQQWEEPGLKKRRVRMHDGRYMIFYTFEDQPTSSPEDTQVRRPEPEPIPKSEDERGV